MRALSRAELSARIDRVLQACGGGRVLYVGPESDVAVSVFRSRAVLATGLSSDVVLAQGCAIPADDRAFDVVCLDSLLDERDNRERASIVRDALRVARRAVLLVASGRPREAWERECLEQHCRKHPLHQIIAPYDGLDWLRDPLEMLFEPLPADVAIGRSIGELSAARDLHMDMLREAGRRADAHVARYMLARQFIRPGDHVLDAACGLGYGTAILSDGTLAASLVGLDADRWAIDYAADHYGRHRRRVAFETRNITDLECLPAGSFDAIVTFETLEHLADPDAFLAACQRLLTPAGRVIGSVPNRWVDESGRDPNPHHLHVYDRERLVRDCGKFFMVEQVFGQTAGGGLKLPTAGRALWADTDSGLDAEWWLVVGMSDPAASTEVPFRSGLSECPDENRGSVLAFARDYQNPWLARALVTIGLRATSPALLDRMVEDVRRGADPKSADAGAALCVAVYRCLERHERPSPELLDAIAAYCSVPTTVPHVTRWQVSLRYAEALVWITAGEWALATEALETCASANALAFSPLLATKTTGAALMRGWIAAQTGDLAGAHRWWTLGLEHAERAMTTPWDSMLLNRETPALFGMREAALVVDLASRCASGLHLLPHAAERPGIVAAQMFESLAERAEYERRQRGVLLSELDRAREWAEVAERELTRLQAEVVRLGAGRASHREAHRVAAKGGSLPGHLRIAVFGAGSGGRLALDALHARGGRVVCVADNNASRHGTTLDDVPIVDPATLPARAVDVVVVASKPGHAAIVEQLERLGYQAGVNVTTLDEASTGPV